MTANNSKFYFSFLNKSVNEYNNSYPYSVCKKPIDADCTALTKEIETNRKAPKFKFGDRVRIIK